MLSSVRTRSICFLLRLSNILHISWRIVLKIQPATYSNQNFNKEGEEKEMMEKFWGGCFSESKINLWQQNMKGGIITKSSWY